MDNGPVPKVRRGQYNTQKITLSSLEKQIYESGFDVLLW